MHREELIVNLRLHGFVYTCARVQSGECTQAYEACAEIDVEIQRRIDRRSRTNAKETNDDIKRNLVRRFIELCSPAVSRPGVLCVFELSLRPSEINPYHPALPSRGRVDVINAISPRNFHGTARRDVPADTEFKKDAKGARTHVHFIRHSFEPLNELRRRAGPLRQLLQILRQLRL